MELKFIKQKAETAVRGNKSEIGIIVYGKLAWEDTEYNVVSGPWQNGAIPNGDFEIKIRNVVVGSNLESGFEDTQTNKRWFIPLEAKFQTNRQGFGIHPDGNIEGTQGCIGLVGRDANLFWTKWLNTKLKARPTTLTVTGTVGAPGTMHEIKNASAAANE